MEKRLQWFGVAIDSTEPTLLLGQTLCYREREDVGMMYWQYAELQQTA